MGPRMKQWNKKRIKAHSLTHNISRVGKCAGGPGWDQDKFTSESSRWDQLAQPRNKGG
jgi:hypothetical protein